MIFIFDVIIFLFGIAIVIIFARIMYRIGQISGFKVGEKLGEAIVWLAKNNLLSPALLDFIGSGHLPAAGNNQNGSQPVIQSPARQGPQATPGYNIVNTGHGYQTVSPRSPVQGVGNQNQPTNSPTGTGQMRNAGRWAYYGNNQNKNSAGKKPIYDPSGKPLLIDTKVDFLDSGGEGQVYKAGKAKNINNVECFIKLYNDSARKDTKKMSMVSKRIERMTEILPLSALQKYRCYYLAWPIMKVFDDPNASWMIGFVMLKVEGEPFRGLFAGPRVILKKMPGWDRSCLVKTALDYVSKVRFLASHKIYVNDFNPANFFVDKRCNVSFIDCDSFQIYKRDGKTPFITYTRMKDYFAPELKPAEERDIHQVEFGVAIIVYQMIMAGLHPFQCRDPKGVDDTRDIQDNIMKGRCAIVPGKRYQFSVSWNHFNENMWNSIPYSLKRCFIKTFGEGLYHPERRASLNELEDCLKKALQPHAMPVVDITPPPPPSPVRYNGAQRYQSPAQQYRSPAPQQYRSPAPQQHRSPAPQQHRSPAPQYPRQQQPAPAAQNLTLSISPQKQNQGITYVPPKQNAPTARNQNYSMYQIYSPAVDDDDD